MLKVGKRTLKTALALAISLGIYILLFLLNHALGFNEVPSHYVTSEQFWYVPTNFYTPFFAGIATVYAMHPNIASSKKQAKIRSVGSVIGGYFGFLVVMVFELFALQSGTLAYHIVLYAFTVIGIIPLLKIIQLTNNGPAGFISCLTYLSVTISIRNGGMEALLFTTNRVLSTIIGVMISVWINTPHNKNVNNDVLFIAALDDCLFDKKKQISDKISYRLQDFNQIGMKITYMTSRTVPFIQHAFRKVGLKHPVIVMNGAAIYDPVSEQYSSVVHIDHQARSSIEQILTDSHVNAFSYVINQQNLCAYYNSIDEAGSYDYFNHYYNAHTNLTEAQVPSRLDVVCYVIIEKNEKVVSLFEQFSHIDSVNAYYHPYENLDGYSLLRITSKLANKGNAVLQLKQIMNSPYTVCIGGRDTDAKALEVADYAIATSSSPNVLKEKADFIVDDKDNYEIIRLLQSLYSDKNLKNTK